MSGLTTTELGDIARLQPGINVSAKAFGSGLPYVTVQDLYSGTRIPTDKLRLVSVPASTAKKFSLVDGDIVIGKSSVKFEGIGYPSLFKDPGYTVIFSGFTLRIQGNPKQVLNEYLFHWLRLPSTRNWVMANAQRSALTNLNADIIRRIPVQYPAINQQTKIAEVLSTVDRAIEQTEALIAKQQRIKTGLMQDLLTRGIDEQGNLRSEETHQFMDSPLGRIPVEWTVKALSNLVDEGITYGIVQAGPHIENGVPYIRTGDMTSNAINVRTLLRTSKKIAESYNRSAVYCGDIVFALRATVGKVLPVTKELDGANLTQGTAKISPKDSIDSTFLLWAIRTSKVQDAIRLEQKGTTFMEITLGDLRGIRLALPKEKDEQSVIAKKLEKHDCLRRDYVNHRDKLLSLKTALMQDLLTGKVRVTELLKQITTTAEGVA